MIEKTIGVILLAAAGLSFIYLLAVGGYVWINKSARACPYHGKYYLIPFGCSLGFLLAETALFYVIDHHHFSLAGYWDAWKRIPPDVGWIFIGVPIFNTIVVGRIFDIVYGAGISRVKNNIFQL